MIDIKGINHFYKRGKGPVRQALDGIHLHVPEKNFFALTGPNGGGKSTLFRILSGLLKPGSGQVYLNGMDLWSHPLEVRRLLGVVFQHPALDGQLSVLENFQIHASMYRLEKGMLDKALEEDLSWTGLKDRLHDRVGTLSGGMQRRAELVKALLHRPRLLLMDEPTTGLDPGARKAFWETIFHFRDRLGLTVLTTTHLFDEAEQADRVAILHQGKILADGPPEVLAHKLGNEMIVIHTKDSERAQRLEQKLSSMLPLTVLRQGGELRVEGASQEVVEDLIRQRGDLFDDIAIKHPTLQDYFIHITGANTQETP
ncbi:MAG: ABC transporter ATP-binding protein [Nitrospirae bacterium]|nr:ABC transporter ATP-binding protein [Magnetococcales bacterium]HAT48991.1 ABC transporter ATP-binding protein [Alphaproteobacteria bacterium]